MSIVLDIPLASILDPSKIGQFIGVKGRNIKTIEKANKVVLNLQQGDTCHSVRITGFPDRVAMAKINVLQLICAINKHDSRHVFSIPTRMVGYLIGKNGSKINEIKTTSGAKVVIDKSDRSIDAPTDANKINDIKTTSGSKGVIDKSDKSSDAPTDAKFTKVMVYGDLVEITSALSLIHDRLSGFGNNETIYERPDKKEFFDNWDELDLQ